MRKLVCAALAGVFLASPVMAADEGLYVGAGLGSMSLDLGPFSGDDMGFKVLGGWMFTPYIGAELEYIDGGSAEDLGATIDTSGFNASLRGALPIGEQFSLFAKVGMMFWDVDVDFDDLSGSDSGEDFSWGVGAGFDFTENLGVMVEYQGFEIEDTDTVDLVSASLTWRF